MMAIFFTISFKITLNLVKRDLISDKIIISGSNRNMYHFLTINPAPGNESLIERFLENIHTVKTLLRFAATEEFGEKNGKRHLHVLLEFDSPCNGRAGLNMRLKKATGIVPKGREYRNREVEGPENEEAIMRYMLKGQKGFYDSHGYPKEELDYWVDLAKKRPWERGHIGMLDKFLTWNNIDSMIDTFKWKNPYVDARRDIMKLCMDGWNVNAIVLAPKRLTCWIRWRMELHAESKYHNRWLNYEITSEYGRHSEFKVDD